MYGRDQYQQAAATTAGPAQLVLMLYDGALVRLEIAREAIEDGRKAAAHDSLIRVQAIIDELTVSLDMDRGGEVARNLAELYDYCTRQLVDANIHKDAGLIADVEAVIRGLRDAWDHGVVRGSVAVAG